MQRRQKRRTVREGTDAFNRAGPGGVGHLGYERSAAAWCRKSSWAWAGFQVGRLSDQQLFGVRERSAGDRVARAGRQRGRGEKKGDAVTEAGGRKGCRTRRRSARMELEFKAFGHNMNNKK